MNSVRETTYLSKYRISAAQLSKLLACLYIVISKALVPLGYLNGGIMLAVLVVLTIATIASDNAKPKLNNFLLIELVFVFITLATGFAFSRDKALVLDSFQTLIYGFLFGYSMIRISIRENSINWFAKAWTVSGVILVAYIFLTGGYSAGQMARITAREGMNSNTLGVFMVFAIWCTLHLLSETLKKRKHEVVSVIISIIVIVSFLYILIGSGSRKAFIASLFVIIFWIVFGSIPTFRHIPAARRLFVLLIIIVLILLIYFRFRGMFISISETMDYRMRLLSNTNITDMRRFELIKDAFKVFWNHPVTGVGWNNYRLYSFSSQYSHCTYVEVLACTGIVGSIFAYALWFIMIRNVFRSIYTERDYTKAINVLALLGVFIFINAVQIMYYNSSLLMIMHLFIALTVIRSGSLKRK